MDAFNLNIERKDDKGAGNVGRKKKGRNSRENEVKSGIGGSTAGRLFRRTKKGSQSFPRSAEKRNENR